MPARFAALLIALLTLCMPQSVLAAGFEESCWGGATCDDGLSCQFPEFECLHAPRLLGEACDGGEPCATGSHCAPHASVCVPDADLLKPAQAESTECAGLYEPLLSEGARLAGEVRLFGVAQATDGVGWTEVGVAYGPAGEFSCYRSSCEGGQVGSEDFAVAAQLSEWSALSEPRVLTGRGETGLELVRPDGQHRLGRAQRVSLDGRALPPTSAPVRCDTTSTDVVQGFGAGSLHTVTQAALFYGQQASR